MREASSEPAAAADGPLSAALSGLGWLAPDAAALAELARRPQPSWAGRLRCDPGIVLLAVRQPVPAAAFPSLADRLREPAVLEDALRQLSRPGLGFVDWHADIVRPVYRTAVRIARLAAGVGRRLGRADLDRVWAAGLLTPLGWLAVAALDPEAVAACLADPAFVVEPAAAQRRHWGLDAPAVGRRLAHRWGLPAWLAACLRVDLPLDVGGRLGDAGLFAVVRLAAALAREDGFDLGLVGREAIRECTAALGLPPDFRPTELEEADPPSTWQDPAAAPLLPDLLAVALDNRRLRAAAASARLENELDELHRLLAERVRGEAERLRTAKLNALAEFASGAGHEINNPLAVISGQAQYLLGHSAEWFAGAPESDAAPVRKALQAIIGQTRRVHGLLRDLMLFARPAAPAPRPFDLPTLLGETAAALSDLAAQRKVRLEVRCPVERLGVVADPEQVRLALLSLARNAVEAAPADGWARLTLEPPTLGRKVVVAVEDSGPGPDPARRDVLFDPFFSGRDAGRGRGLGLPIAWRLAKLQGGEVALESAASLGEGPTRFVLRLPPPADRDGQKAA